MDKIVFKNMYVNIIIGGLLLLAALLGYFIGWIEDFLPIFVGIILLFLSTKRFAYSFKKAIGKYSTLVLVIEYVLDLVFVALLIVLQNHLNLFIGLVIYIRGVSYLIINYLATRKIKIVQYIFNIGYLTLGAFLLFSSLDIEQAMIIGVAILVLVVGGIYLQYGLQELIKKEEREEKLEKELKEKQKSQSKHLKEKQKAEIKSLEQNEKDNQKIQKLEEQVKLEKERKASVEKENKELEKQVKSVKKTEQKPNPLEEKTVAQLRQIAKEKGLTGYSSLTKAELIAKIDEKK